MPDGWFDKVVDAVKQLGIPTVVAGVLLWFTLTRVDHVLENVEALMAAGRTTQLEMQKAQYEFKEQWAQLIARGCIPAP